MPRRMAEIACVANQDLIGLISFLPCRWMKQAHARNAKEDEMHTASAVVVLSVSSTPRFEPPYWKLPAHLQRRDAW